MHSDHHNGHFFAHSRFKPAGERPTGPMSDFAGWRWELNLSQHISLNILIKNKNKKNCVYISAHHNGHLRGHAFSNFGGSNGR